MPFALFVFGGLAAAFALIVELVLISLSLSPDSSLSPSLLTLLIAVLIEEGSKCLFLRRATVFFFRNVTLSVKQTLLLGALFGLGFSVPEFWLAATGLDIFRFFPISSIILVHTATSLLLAYAILGKKRRRTLLIAFITAFLLHGTYNMAIFRFFPVS